ncbi:AAA family ATPase [Symmachiella dynata]|uniref:AAA family ATPase n=1 Tax=Symmachiella dynata TaxID=2527995 RepID=UPI0030ED7EA6
MLLTTESEVIDWVRTGEEYQKFRANLLPHKIEREGVAWSLIQAHRGEFTPEIFGQVLDKVDTGPNGQAWFGPMLATPNRNLIFQSSAKAISAWIDTLLFQGLNQADVISKCLVKEKLNGVGIGLTTLLLYLSDPEKYSIWVKATAKGLITLGRLEPAKGYHPVSRYQEFNQAAIAFRQQFEFQPAEIDWVLTWIGKRVERTADGFIVGEKDNNGNGDMIDELVGWTDFDLENARFWKIAPGQNAWNWEACRDGGFIAIGWDELGDLSNVDKKEFDKRTKVFLRDHDNFTKAGVTQVWRFSQIQIGDYIVANRGTTEVLGIGVVTGPYEYVDVDKHCHHLPVDWKFTTGVKVLHRNWVKTLIELSREKFEAILEAAIGSIGPAVNPLFDLETCAAETLTDLTLLKRWVKAIHRKRQAVFYGPPGTGKTFLTEHIARHLVGGGNGFVELVQFHPAYAYEDFIQGIRPETNDEGTLTYEMQAGRFVDFCREAARRDGTCVLIIDEINRANLARVFGELMYLLEYRDREMPLAGGGMFKIPDNVRVIGTMNTADRSIALVDHALRRRFAFLPLYPDYTLLQKFHEENSNGFSPEGLIKKLQEINAAINDRHYEIGVSFFLVPKLTEHLADIWAMEIEPYLEEYFFDQPAKVASFRWEAVSSKVLP